MAKDGTARGGHTEVWSLLKRLERTTSSIVDFMISGYDINKRPGMVIIELKQWSKTDQSLRGIKKLYKEHPEDAVDRADEIIKNTYRTLMTRGMKGCYIYCTDPGMRKYIRKRLEMISE